MNKNIIEKDTRQRSAPVDDRVREAHAFEQKGVMIETIKTNNNSFIEENDNSRDDTAIKIIQN